MNQPTHSKEVVEIMEGLEDTAREKINRISTDGRVGVIFAEIKDQEHRDGEKSDEPGFRARIEQILYLAKSGEADNYYEFGVIQMALTVRSWDLWENLWREKHPDRGDEWDVGIDHSLMKIWREKVRRLFIEHNQEQVLSMSTKEYKKRLAEGNLNVDTAGQIADFFYKAFHES